MRCSAVALCAVLAGCAPPDMGGMPAPEDGRGIPTNPCGAALPCPDGDPVERYARCDAWVCTMRESQGDGVVRVRCWDMPAYRSRVQGGDMWSDGAEWRVCDASGEVRASGMVDGDGVPECADVCEEGFCPAPGGEALPACP